TFGELAEIFNRPKQAGEIVAGVVRKTFVTAWVPNIVKHAVRAGDPAVRDYDLVAADQPFWTREMARIPYEALPLSAWGNVPRHDIWGRPMEKETPFGRDGLWAGLYRFAIPVNVYDADVYPLDRLILNFNRRVRDGELGDVSGESVLND